MQSDNHSTLYQQQQPQQPQRPQIYRQRRPSPALPILYQHFWWQHSLVGYAAGLIFVVVAFLLIQLETIVAIREYFIGLVFVIGTFLIAWIWGTGPAIFALLIGALCTDYLGASPDRISFYIWPGPVSLLPYLVIQFLFIWLIARQKHFQAHLLLVQQELTQFAGDLRENNAQLVQEGLVKDQFLSVASHELRTPVTTIHGSIQLLLRRIKKQNDQTLELLPIHDALIKIEVQTRRLTDLITDLLDINRLHSGKISLQRVPTDLRNLCRKVVEEYQSETDQVINLCLPTVPLIVLIDEQRLSQALHNLVSNALKYSPQGAPIHVEACQKSDKAIIAVHNEGPALSLEHQQRIFEPFYRSPQAQASSTPGWGLGLAISKELVDQHQGQLRVESAEGNGVTFTIALPLDAPSEP